MAHTCRGTINLAGAFIDTIDSTNFVITNGPSQVYHLRALNEVERQRWVTTLELAKSKAIKNLESGEHCVHLASYWGRSRYTASAGQVNELMAVVSISQPAREIFVD